MGPLIVVVGVVQIIGGIAAYAEAASAIHQILGAISFGMGVLSVALGIGIVHLVSIRDAIERQVAIFDKLGKK